MKQQRHEWEARKPEFSKEDFEAQEKWTIGVAVCLVLLFVIAGMYLVTHA